jgi:hypothetical protein
MRASANSYLNSEALGESLHVDASPRLECVKFFDFTCLMAIKNGALRGLRNRYQLRCREAVRDLSTAFALLTSLKMTENACL